MDLYDDFEAWINKVFDNDIPTEVVAINFNIYEDVDNKWSIEPVGRGCRIRIKSDVAVFLFCISKK